MVIVLEVVIEVIEVVEVETAIEDVEVAVVVVVGSIVILFYILTDEDVEELLQFGYR